ncbi:MAG: nucleoside deaminase [Bacillota bacterium]
MTDQAYMALALEEARKAYKKKEVPIGAVIVKDDVVIARGHNLRESNQQVSHHAEMIAIENACHKLSSWRLDGCTMFITSEPCSMCSGAIIQSRISRVVYGTEDPKNGAHVSKVHLFDIPFNHIVDIQGHVMQDEARKLLKDFFNTLRNPKNDV